MVKRTTPLLFDFSDEKRRDFYLEQEDLLDIDKKYLREQKPNLPHKSELMVVRHFTKLSEKNFSVDTHLYPLGSCTMKYSPFIMRQLAALPQFLNHHPLSSEKDSQGILECLFEMQEFLKEVTGLHSVSLTPMAGAQGEFAGVAMIRAYHESRGDNTRQEMIIPDAAHGTNPASARMVGFEIREIATLSSGDIDLKALKGALSNKTAGIMLTNPSTLGVFERNIEEIARLVHDAGGLLYCDGANLNAILGKVRPKEMGFDVIHLNLHKTFGAPHGGGGPGSGPIVANKLLAPFLPVPLVAKKNGSFFFQNEGDRPHTIGRLSAFFGNIVVVLQAYIYIMLLGREKLAKVAEIATLNANYLMKALKDVGFTLPYEERRATHEFVVSLAKEAKKHGVTAKDCAKRLLDYGFHAPTVYFPLLIPECLLIEPTETESKEDLDAFIEAMEAILKEAKDNPQMLKEAPHETDIKRLDEVKAARELDVVWRK